MGFKNFRVKLSTGWWTVVVEPIWGWCNYSHLNTIIIVPTKPTKARLNTTIHEAIHATKPSLLEADVSRMADDITEIVWRDGYRKVDK